MARYTANHEFVHDEGRTIATASSPAIAAQIVHALNGHADLLAACDMLVQVVEQLVPEPSARGVADVVLLAARAALAKAKAGSEVGR